MAQLPAVVLSDDVNEVVLHISVAVGTENTGVLGQLIVEGPPTPLMLGGVISLTVMVCEAVAVLPHWSVAVHFLVTE